MADWSARRLTLFDVDEQTQTLTDGDPDFTAATGTILILEAVVRRSSRDTPVYPISREMYQRIPSKTQEGLPTSLWHNIATNLVTLWTTPENSTDVLRYQRLRRKQDVVVMGETPDAPYVYHDALCAGMAWKLSEKFAPHLYDKLELRHEKALARAVAADREFVDVQFDLGG